MRKPAELAVPASCLNRTDDDEMLFVLLSRDAAAPANIRFWVEERNRICYISASHQDQTGFKFDTYVDPETSLINFRWLPVQRRRR